MRTTARAAFVIMVVCALPSMAVGGVQTVAVAASSLKAITTVEGTHYVVEFELPQNLGSVRSAWLEVRLDVSVRNDEGPTDPAPMLEVYMLKNTLSGDPAPADFEETRLPMSRPVALGTNRLVKIDITEFAQRIFADPTKNHGIVIGSLTGARTGEFLVKLDGFGPGTPVRLTIIE